MEAIQKETKMINPKLVCNIVTSQAVDRKYHHKTLDILEGNLEPYILKCLERQLSARVFMYAKDRLVPINIMPRYIEKLSNIYQTGVARSVTDGDQSDMDLLSWYEKELHINAQMHLANKLYNACGSALLHPYVTEDGPALRVIPNDLFAVYSDDTVNPRNPTMVILLAGKDNLDRDIYWVYTATEFAVVKSDETIDRVEMERLGLGDGINPYGVLPFIYINSSSLRLCPVPDMDTLRMTEYIPTALTDLNLAAMFSAFSITYVTNGNIENLTYAPNALWFLKSDDPDKTPTLGTLKPEVDYAEVLNLIQSELSLFMGTKGIKAASVGQIGVENAASGIAKIIDESDTFDVRQAQTVVFGMSEHELWELILRDMHPVWVSQGMVENRAIFTSTATVETKFAIIPVGTQRTQLIAEQRDEYASGFTTRKRAIAALNPQMTAADIDALILEIDKERGIDNGNEAPENQNPTTGTNQGRRSESTDSGPSDRADSGAN